MPNCRVCDVELVVGESWPNSFKNSKYYICRTCNRENVNKRFNERKLKDIEYLGSKCNKCGGEFPHYVYDFHHVDPTEKEGKLSQMRKTTWEKMKAELDKCVLLCANCHRIEHHGNDTGEINDE